MFADVAEELQISNRAGPVGIIDQTGRIVFRIEIEQFLELLFYAGDIRVQSCFVEELALGCFPAGIANRTGGAAGHRNRVISHKLEAPQREQRNEAADMKAVGSRIESGVKSDRPGGEALL